MRPQFQLNDLRVSEGAGEVSYLPSDYAPHTITANVVELKHGERGVVFSFEYSIDEDPSSPQTPDPGIVILSAKYSGKILEIRLPLGDTEDLLGKTVTLMNRLNIMAGMTDKQSHKKHLRLVHGLIRKFRFQLQNDVAMQHALREALESP
jgi:hypothetical protein